MAARKLTDAEVSALLQAAIDQYVAAQSWFYEEQIKPYLPAISDHIIKTLKAKGLHVQTDK